MATTHDAISTLDGIASQIAATLAKETGIRIEITMILSDATEFSIAGAPADVERVAAWIRRGMKRDVVIERDDEDPGYVVGFVEARPLAERIRARARRFGFID